MSNAKLGALEDLASVVYKSFMKDIPKKQKEKMKATIPDEVKEAVENKEKMPTPKPKSSKQPQVMGISISKILSAQSDVPKNSRPKKKKPKGRGLRDEI